MKNAIQPETVKNNILRHLQIRGWSQSELERRSGNKKNVSNIIRGISKYPTIEVLQRIANAFNIEINQLISAGEKDIEHLGATNYQLLHSSFVAVTDLTKTLDVKLRLSPMKILDLTYEVYNYSLRLNLDTIEEKFVEWIASKYYDTL